jgi:hypothetical protein
MSEAFASVQYLKLDERNGSLVNNPFQKASLRAIAWQSPT